MFQWAIITRDHMKIDGLKNPSKCFCVFSEDGGLPKYVGFLSTGIFFLVVYLLVLLVLLIWGFFCPVGLLIEEH
jgi:hypothetical protein